jgi:hypothetical protein
MASHRKASVGPCATLSANLATSAIVFWLTEDYP